MTYGVDDGHIKPLRTAITFYQFPTPVWWFGVTLNLSSDPKFSPPPSHHPTLTPDLYLLCVRGGFQGAAVVLRVHHGHVGAAVFQHLLYAGHAAALAARAD